ncbi:MAG TPA: pyridoxal phosphate-dependent aminotransferase, partial [Dehalococcoidia bacterium]|nr:pyridoxal phosphate-dependent aminotransferase [Dehalococcoidia bacterium]
MNSGYDDKNSRLISDRVNSIAPSGIRKFFDLLNSMEGVISLGIGEPDYTTPWHIREAAIYSMEKGMTMYTSNSGIPEVRQELSRYLKKRFDLEYDWRSELLITVGVSEALDLVMRAILNPGDEVILPDPSYVSYPACVHLAGGVPVSIPTYEENDFEISASDIEARITPKTKAILLGYPANPTGAVMPLEKLGKIAEVARKHDILMIVDEIYSQLIYGVKHTCIAALPGMQEHTVLLNGFSKSFAMTGWRIGY